MIVGLARKRLRVCACASVHVCVQVCMRLGEKAGADSLEMRLALYT